MFCKLAVQHHLHLLVLVVIDWDVLYYTVMKDYCWEDFENTLEAAICPSCLIMLRRYIMSGFGGTGSEKWIIDLWIWQTDSSCWEMLDNAATRNSGATDGLPFTHVHVKRMTQDPALFGKDEQTARALASFASSKVRSPIGHPFQHPSSSFYASSWSSSCLWRERWGW